MVKETIWGKISALASDIPGMMISIGSGFAGLLMPGPKGSAAANLLNGNIEDAFGAISYNYAGVNVYSNQNDLGSMLKRAKGTWAAVAGQLLKSIYKSF